MADTFDAGKFGAYVAIPFSHSNATTQDSNKDMSLAIDTQAVMPVAGSVIAIGAAANASLTAGTITFKPHSAGTEYADTGVPAPAISSAAQVSYATVRPGVCTFAAGAKLGVSFSSTTTLDPTNTADLDAILFVQFNPT